MPNINVRLSQKVRVGGSAEKKGHVGQEVKEHLDVLMANPQAVLVPSPETATGFRPLPLGERHREKGFVIDTARASESIAPAPELLAAMGEFRSRRAFIPEVWSDTLSRNVRFMVSLPGGFDAKKASEYPVVHVLPDDKTLAAHLAGGLTDALTRELASRGLENAIIVVVERLEHNPGADRVQVNLKGRRALESDIAPYVTQAFGGKQTVAATLTLPDLEDFRAIITAPDLRREDRSAFVESQQRKEPERKGWFSSVVSFWLGSSDDEPRTNSDLRQGTRGGPIDNLDGYTFRSDETQGGKRKQVDESPREEKKTSFVGSLVIGSKDRPKITGAGGWDGKVRTAVPLPDAKFFAPLEKLDHAGVAIAAVSSRIADDVVPYAAIVPQGFSPKTRYPVDLVLTPAGSSVADVAKKLAADGLHVQDRVVIIIDSASFKGEGAGLRAAAHAKNELLAAVADALPVDLNAVHQMRALGTEASSWAASIEAAPQSPARAAGGPVVFSDGAFRIMPPTNDYERSFPSLGWSHKGTTEIPRELQKQPAGHGTMFVPVIDSKAIGKPLRTGVYLPPGYDPASNEKLPVLLMLPGKGGALHQWTSVGDVTTKLDAMMEGAGQKMIVVIPDATDSFWFDYDKNGSPSVGDKGKRDYEGLLMDEVLPFVLKGLNADPDKLAIAGISRGGFGAMSLAARHGDRFKSVSAHSGVLALEHDGELSKLAGGEISKHFGPAGDPVWKAFNPKDLVEAGKFKKDARVRVDIGAQDQLFVDDNISFVDAMDKKGVAVDFRIYGGDTPKAEKKHNWDTWSALLPSWIGFHQQTFGKAGAVELQGVKDVTDEVRTARTSAGKKAEAELRARVGALTAKLPLITEDDKRLTVAAYAEPRRMLVRPFAELATSLEELKGEIRAFEKEPRVHVLEARLGKLEERVETLAARVRRTRAEVFGPVAPGVLAKPGALEALPANVKADLNKVLETVPDMRRALEKLATIRPAVFVGVDPITKENFASQLKGFVNSKHFNKDKDGEGIVEFIDRMADRRYDWRRGGYSNAVTAVMNTIFNHPGIVLTLTKASRNGDTLKFPSFYAGDPATRLKPMGDLESAFSPVERTGGEFGLPPAALGYERAILRIVRDELCPPKDSMPDTRAFGQRTNMPVAEGLAKLRGREMLYGYAFNLKTGDDLVKAVQSQGREGLAMADTKVSVRGGPYDNVHFPVFYDFDPATRTIEMQHWGMGATRVKVDDLRFEDVGIYYEPNAGIAPFLTPEKQGNWGALKAAMKASEGPTPEEGPSSGGKSGKGGKGDKKSGKSDG